jgi:hypothetical protein
MNDSVDKRGVGTSDDATTCTDVSRVAKTSKNDSLNALAMAAPPVLTQFTAESIEQRRSGMFCSHAKSQARLLVQRRAPTCAEL